MDVMELLTSTLIQGLIYALISYGVYITYSILDFPDLGGGWHVSPGGRCHGGADDQGRRSLADPARLP